MMNSQSTNKNRIRSRLWMLPLIVCVAVGTTFCIVLGKKPYHLHPVEAAPIRGVFSNEARQIATMRRASLIGDRSQIPLMMNVLAAPSPPHPLPPHPLVVKTALSALARLGAIEALEVIDNSSERFGVGPHYLRVIKMRLEVEDAARKQAKPVQSSAKLADFYAHLHFTPAKINEGVANSQNASQRDLPEEVVALRQIADMVYNGQYSDFSSLAGINSLNFQADFPASLKMRLAPLSRTERVKTLIVMLAHTERIVPNVNYELQLAVDEGTLASQAAAAQLQQMDAHRDQYPREGWDAMFRVLGGTGDATQAPLVETYTHDKDGYISYFANSVYPEMKTGQRGIYRADY